MAYYIRIILACLTLLLLLGMLIWRGPQTRDVALVATTPLGTEVAPGATISLTFSRQVDRRSAEALFTLTPAAPGRFFWDGPTLSFRPDQPLVSDTTYQVAIAAGLIDVRGHPNSAALSWTFHTRRPRLLLVGSAPDGTSQIELADHDGSHREVIATDSAPITGIILAPDHRRAIYTRQQRQRLALMLLNLEERYVRPLVDTPNASASGPAWSPLSDIIAFERAHIQDTVMEHPRLWLAQPDGTSLGPLYGDHEHAYAAVWSPGGDQLAFLNGIEQTLEIFNFTNERRRFPAHASDPATWSPDGRALVYASTTTSMDGTGSRLRRVDLDNDTIQNLTDGTFADRHPTWSPDGAWIAFTRHTDGGGSSIWVIPADGGTARQVTFAGDDSDDIQPAWAPDSRHIAFIRTDHVQRTRSAWMVAVESGDTWPVLDGIEHLAWVR